MLYRTLKIALLVLLLGGLSVGAQELQTSSATRPRTVTKATSVRTIANGEKVELVGNVTKAEGDTFSICDMKGAETVVVLTPETSIKTHRRGILRGKETRDKTALLVGLNLEVEGRGNGAGQLVAKSLKFHDSDWRAQTQVDTRAIPIEAELVRQAGQLDETAVVATTARKDAKSAQDSADKAQASADLAQSSAAQAQAAAVAANTRIGAIDDYETAEALTINFKVGSSALSPEAKSQLDAFAAKSASAKGFVIQISAFASNEGGLRYNHDLSARRADAVVDYLVGVGNVPVRRILTPYSGGIMNPIGDNTTLEGRMQNRRAEVKMLVSKGLAAQETVSLPPDK